ncbi:MAG: alpha/beta fold hydrolase [Alkalilacustris sp.]
MSADMVRLPDGLRIATAAAGPAQAPGVQLIPGLGGVGAFWDGVTERLADRFRVVSHDHRGTGASSRPTGPYAIAQMAGDLLAVMDHHGMDRAILLGHSTGGAIAQEVALGWPDRVRALVLSATWAGPDPAFLAAFALRRRVLLEMGAAAYGVLGQLMLRTPEQLNARPALLDPDPDAAAAALGDPAIVAARIGALMAHDRCGDLPALRVPTLVVCAADDRVAPVHMSRALAALIPQARLAVLPGGGHFLPQEAPEAFLSVVAPFLDALPPATAA